jgi:hypothetical protein
MWPATAWDDADWGGGTRARGWTVMGSLRSRRDTLRREALAARRRIQEKEERLTSQFMTAAVSQQALQDEIKARWAGGPSVLALLFAQPDSDAVRSLDHRGEYFDRRSGDTWDLFFPGYFRSPKDEHFERAVGAVPIGQGFLRDWYFSPPEFNQLRATIEQKSEGRWHYSGGTDLVLVNAWMPATDEPTIDWASTLSGCVTDATVGDTTLALPQVIERISRDLELALEDPDYGVGAITGPQPGPNGSGTTGRDLVVNALGGIIATLGAKALGID